MEEKTFENDWGPQALVIVRESPERASGAWDMRSPTATPQGSRCETFCGRPFDQLRTGTNRAISSAEPISVVDWFEACALFFLAAATRDLSPGLQTQSPSVSLPASSMPLAPLTDRVSQHPT